MNTKPCMSSHNKRTIILIAFDEGERILIMSFIEISPVGFTRRSRVYRRDAVVMPFDFRVWTPSWVDGWTGYVAQIASIACGNHVRLLLSSFLYLQQRLDHVEIERTSLIFDYYYFILRIAQILRDTKTKRISWPKKWPPPRFCTRNALTGHSSYNGVKGCFIKQRSLLEVCTNVVSCNLVTT